MALLLQQLILFNSLIFKGYLRKSGFAPIHAQPASALAYRKFSNSNAHGYPQE
ncbi:hypothetical protein GBAG_1159 [Buttiauxella agrestis ATCC 33320]|uniref:Uncharacterized protein n=1 Tax=Buttiauxella agrestis ATCC 33320 TaxID=1006004 RepID=A0A085GGE5_9ENTR|nr:hypothetical protein GBAG_1159 [Buttiauxella agrestis ATCC 33320]